MGRLVVKKDSVDKAAIKLFAQKGIKDVLTVEIAAEAGTADATFYNHYANKGEMVWQLYRNESEQFSKGLAKVFKSDGEAKETLEKVVCYIYKYYETKPHQFLFALRNQYNFPEEEKWIDEKDDSTVMMAKYISKIKLRECYKNTNPFIVAGLVMGLVMNPVILHSHGKIIEPISTYIPNVTEAVNCLLF